MQGGGHRGASAPRWTRPPCSAPSWGPRALIGHRHPRLVLWPEDVVALDGPLAGSPQAAAMSALARRLRATVVAGVTVPVGTTAFRNEVVAWGPSGRIVGTYEKVHRVPFGEYVPLPGLLRPLRHTRRGPRTTPSPATAPGCSRTPAGAAGRAGLLRGLLRRAQPLLGAGRGRAAGGAHQHLVLRLHPGPDPGAGGRPGPGGRAEGGTWCRRRRPGYSAVVDDAGDVLGAQHAGPPPGLVATVALRTGRTLYNRTGDVPVLVPAALSLAAGWVPALGPRLRRRPRRQQREQQQQRHS